MHRFTPRLSTLPPAQRQLWPALRPAPSLGLVLYGGTAIAVRLGHRPSVDFDFFTDQPLDKPALFDAFPFLRQTTVLQDAPNTLTVLIGSNKTADQFVKISFFGDISFGRIGEPEMTDDGILQVASLDDLMATKLKVVLQRVENEGLSRYCRDDHSWSGSIPRVSRSPCLVRASLSVQRKSQSTGLL